jgi:hypothetical protein
MIAHVGYSVPGRSRGQVVPCVVCTVHKKMRSAYFLIEPQNQGRRFPGLGLKIGSSILVIWYSKSLQRFLGLSLKPTDYGLSVAPQNRREDVSTRGTRRDLSACFI